MDGPSTNEKDLPALAFAEPLKLTRTKTKPTEHIQPVTTPPANTGSENEKGKDVKPVKDKQLDIVRNSNLSQLSLLSHICVGS